MFHKHYGFSTTYYLLREPKPVFSYAMLTRPKKAKTAVHGYKHSVSLFFMIDIRVNTSYQQGLSAKFSGFKLGKGKCFFI